MRIIISDMDKGAVDIHFDCPSEVTFQMVYERLMAALEGSVESFMREVKPENEEAFRSHMYDVLDASFGRFLSKVFPEIQVCEFNLSAAARVYAEDQIIQKAEAEGKTYQEMLDEYEAIADAYIAEKKGLA